MVPRLKGELRTPPGEELRLAEPWELCPPRRLHEGGVHGRRREAVGGVRPAHFLQCGTHLRGVGGHVVHIGLLANGHHGHPQAGGHCQHLAGARLGLGMPRLCAGHEVPDTGGTGPAPPPLSPGGASAPSGLSTACAACAASFALRDVARSRSRVFTLAASRSRSLVTSANRDWASRLSSLALDTRASRSRLAASALIARASHAPARCCSTHSCTTPSAPAPRPAPRAPPAPHAPPGWPYAGLWGGGGLRVPLGAAFPLAGGGVVLLLDVNDVSHPHLPLPPPMDAHGKPCHVRPLRPPLVLTREHIQPKNPSRGHRPLLPNPRHPGLHPPVPTRKPVGKQAHQLLPLGQVAPPPLTTMGQGKEMRKVPCTPRDSKTMSHMAVTCRCRPSGPGGTCWVQAGSGCLAARVTRSKGGSVWASPKSSRAGMGTTTSRATCPAAVLVSLPVPAERPERREPSLRTMLALLGGRLPPVPAGGSPPVPPGSSPCSSGNRGRGLYLRLVWCRIFGEHAKNGTCRCGEVCKAQIEKGGVDKRQCNNNRNKTDEIHRKSYKIRTKFVRTSYEFCANFKFP